MGEGQVYLEVPGRRAPGGARRYQPVWPTPTGVHTRESQTWIKVVRLRANAFPGGNALSQRPYSWVQNGSAQKCK